jgi:quinohemoprotein amine dehydrogenase
MPRISGKCLCLGKTVILSIFFLASCSAGTLYSQNATAKTGTGTGKDVQLIPVTDQLVIEKCGTCHQADGKGNLSRISSIRTTPEGWEEAIKRMVRLNGLQLSPDDARKILRYLSDSHGLAPAEATPVQYFVEHRLVDEKMPEVADVQHSCAACHALAKPLSWRRTPDDWDLLKNMHVAFFPSIDVSFRRNPTPGARGGNAAASPGGEAPKQPVDVALDWVKKSTPLITPEWSNWSASVQAPKLAGTWTVSGTVAGKGKFFGQTKIEDRDGTYTKSTKICFINGDTWTSTGSGIVYTGYAWRGRSKGDSKIAGIEAPSGVREVMMLSSNQSELSGRWFWGTYQEFGMDVTMHRDTGAPIVLGTDLSSLKTGSSDNTVRIFGSHLPASIAVSDINLGAGVTVTKVVSSTPEVVSVLATVDAKAMPGRRLVSVAGTGLANAYAVYDKMDYLKVTPTTSLTHLGSTTHPKGYMQFEAVAYSNGPDGKPDTADDIELGPVPAEWKIEEFVASYGDDDTQYVGVIDAKTGFFTPASDGPNPKRKSQRNNYGDVWAVAQYTPAGAPKPLVGRSYLIVTVPQYMQWDQPEVAE